MLHVHVIDAEGLTPIIQCPGPRTIRIAQGIPLRQEVAMFIHRAERFITEVSGACVGADWLSGPSHVIEQKIGSTGTLQFIRGTDTTVAASASQRFLRLKVALRE